MVATAWPSLSLKNYASPRAPCLVPGPCAQIVFSAMLEHSQGSVHRTSSAFSFLHLTHDDSDHVVHTNEAMGMASPTSGVAAIQLSAAAGKPINQSAHTHAKHTCVMRGSVVVAGIGRVFLLRANMSVRIHMHSIVHIYTQQQPALNATVMHTQLQTHPYRSTSSYRYRRDVHFSGGKM